MLKKALKISLGLVLLPFCFGFSWQLGATVFSVPYKAELPYYFVAGGLTYLTLHLLFKKPILAYVFGHELTHALFAMLFGGSVKSFRASERGGQVTVTKSNFLITLAPYFFPLYTFLALVLYIALSASEARTGLGFLVFVIGASFCFHLLLTIIFLREDQKDIREEGALFSYPLIYLFNVLFGALLIHLLLAKKNGFLDFFLNGIMQSIVIVWSLFQKAYGLASGLAD